MTEATTQHDQESKRSPALRARDHRAKVKRFNILCPPGTPVTVKMDNDEERETTVKAPAEMLGGHTAVVWLDGISGCYALDRVTKIPSVITR